VFTVTKCREIFADVHVAAGVPDEGISISVSEED
jgi:hypothetical protein